MNRANLRAKCRVPMLSRHATGQAVVRLCGKDHYVGPFGSAEAQAKYDALITEWLSRGRVLAPADAGELSVNELVLAYWRQHVDPHYRKNGKPTSEVSCIGASLKYLKDAYGLTPVSEFGPLRLKAVREKMIADGMSRRVVNRYVQKVRCCFRWGTENELVPPSVFHGLQSVAGLKAGRTEARETDPVKPVPNAFVDAILPHVSPQARAMIELHRLTGMRPGEVRQLRTCDIDVTGKVWFFFARDIVWILFVNFTPRGRALSVVRDSIRPQAGIRTSFATTPRPRSAKSTSSNWPGSCSVTARCSRRRFTPKPTTTKPSPSWPRSSDFHWMPNRRSS